MNPGLNGPLVDGFDIAPADFNDVLNTTRAIWVGTCGDLAVVFPDGTGVTLKNVPTGTLLPVRAMRVNATGTTATNLVGLY